MRQSIWHLLLLEKKMLSVCQLPLDIQPTFSIIFRFIIQFARHKNEFFQKFLNWRYSSSWQIASSNSILSVQTITILGRNSRFLFSNVLFGALWVCCYTGQWYLLCWLSCLWFSNFLPYYTFLDLTELRLLWTSTRSSAQCLQLKQVDQCAFASTSWTYNKGIECIQISFIEGLPGYSKLYIFINIFM